MGNSGQKSRHQHESRQGRPPPEKFALWLQKIVKVLLEHIISNGVLTSSSTKQLKIIFPSSLIIS